MRHISQNLGRWDGTRNLVGVWDMTLLRGEGLRPHRHEGVEEMYYIVEGQGEMFVQGESRWVSGGDVVYVPPEHVHYLKVKGDAPLRVFVVGVSAEAV